MKERRVSRLITRGRFAGRRRRRTVLTPWRFLIKLRLISNPLAERVNEWNEQGESILSDTRNYK